MRGWLTNVRVGWLALAALAFAGCDQFIETRAKDELAVGDRKAAAGDFRGAVAAYEAAFDGTASTAEAHFKLAVLYDDKLKRPRDAIHHFERYLELAPKGSHAKDAKTILQQVQQRAAIGSDKGAATQKEVARLKNENLRLTTSLVELRAELRKKNSAPAGSPEKGGDGARKPIPPGTRVHIVQPKETMASIAKKYYNNSERWRDIQDANFYSTGGKPQTIKPGQELVIP